MLVEANFKKCILCKERPPDPKSSEHLIPRCIGGTLKAVILCKRCNSEFGSEFVSLLKEDPSIRLAVQNLRERIPAFAARFEEGLNFVAEGVDGTTVMASKKRGRWKTTARQSNGNCLDMDTEKVRTYILNALKKQGLSGSEAESWVNRFAACKNGEQFQLPTGDTLIKNEAPVHLPKLSGPPVDGRVPVLIAFEFLALCIGNSVLGPEFDAVREYIRSDVKTEQIEVLNKRTRKNEFHPEHRVGFHVENQVLTVVVQFFRWYVFEVKFRNISLPSKEIVYVEDLENKQRLIALSPEDAEQGNWAVV